MALLSVIIGGCVGVPLGLLAAARRGATDEIVMRGNDLIFAFPALLLAILITAVFGPGAINAIIAIGIFNIPVFARVTRAGALQQWTRDYTLAARVAGKGPLRISREHILPNLLGLLVVQGNHPVFTGRHRGGWPVVRGIERATADAQLGPHAQ